MDSDLTFIANITNEKNRNLLERLKIFLAMKMNKRTIFAKQ